MNGVVRKNLASAARSLFQSITADVRPPASSRFSATLMPDASVKCW